MFIEIAKAYTSQYPDPLVFDAGDPVHVEREDPDFPGWCWCRLDSGKTGWVHHSFLAARSGDTISIEDYRGTELTVAAGDQAEIVRVLDGWAWVRLPDGRTGWIPAGHF